MNCHLKMMNKIILISHEVNMEKCKIIGFTYIFIPLIFFSKVKTINEKLTIGKISQVLVSFSERCFHQCWQFQIHVPADLGTCDSQSSHDRCLLSCKCGLKDWGGLFLSFSLVSYYRAILFHIVFNLQSQFYTRKASLWPTVFRSQNVTACIHTG